MRFLVALGRRLPAPLRRLAKRVLPAAAGARLQPVSPPASRENVDIVVDDPRLARLWLRATPDTHRIRRLRSFESTDTPGTGAEGWLVLGDASLDGAKRAELLRPMTAPDVVASVLGGTAGPTNLSGQLWIRPDAMAVRKTAWTEIGGSPGGNDPLPGLLQRVRDAGHRIAVQPLRNLGGPVERTDPIEGVGSAVILAGVPLHDVGGGSRGAQLALELLRHGYHVTYVWRFDANESTDLGLRFVHPRLEQVRSQDFDHRTLEARLATSPTLVLIELPVAEYLLVANGLAEAGYRIVYDLLDRWSDASLGGGWYRTEIEREFAGLADALVATAPALVSHLGNLSSRPVQVVPNGVNVALFRQGPGPAPADLPPGVGPVLGYHGSLYGDWFDWKELAAVAAAYPKARVVVIGDVRTPPSLPANVWLLGLKAQSDLPAYVGRFDVGLIPFEVSETTHAVSPLKVFEYLAMGVPVAAPPLEALRDLDGVYVADRLPMAVDRALGAPKPDRDAARRAHSWEERLTRIFSAVDLDLAPPVGPEPRVATRPVRHYAEAERLL